ncbi:ankyrin repeat and KH domain-containing protein mask-like [Teleopsis dalmanni]|uniref:ankyrin repeat and KH domain-containing protein mask-like n=1 Tax=Teleopsis dalmanni TaxID=139649 RepID=UPI0018CDC5DC|nr:ankyrin repeat and KH domain-containing protein mask-like [Teleopsis dalmanni]
MVPNQEKSGKNKNKKKKNAQQNIQQPQTVANCNTRNVRNSSPVAEEAVTKASPKQSRKEEQQMKNVKKSSLESTKVNPASVTKKGDGTNKQKDETMSNKKKDNKQREKENLAPKEIISAPKQQQQQPQTEKPKLEKLDAPPTNPNQTGNRKSLVFCSSRNATYTTEDTKKPDDSLLPRETVNKPSPPKRGEDGWKEVVRKSSTQQNTTTSTNASTVLSSVTSTTTAVPEMTCKKVQVPVNAISRVIGRAGSNINAIRATTGAHIEVEKQGKNQSERSITIKGLPDATKQAHMLILALIKDPDVDILQMLPRMNTSIKASTLPMTVGTWDNKTALQTSSSSSSTSSTPSAPTCSYQVTPTTSTVTTSVSTSMTTTVTKTSIASTKHNNLIPKSQTAISSKISTGRSQSAKAFYSQQPPTRGCSTQASTSSITSTQKHKPGGLETLPNVTKTTPNFNNVIASQKSSNTKQLPTAFISNNNNGNNTVSSQTFAAKLTGGIHNASPKKTEGRIVGTTAPYGRGKPIPSSLSSISHLVSNNNTLSGPIGTFNVADVAAVNAAAAAAAAASQNNVNTTRPVTPIGPPKRNVSPMPNTQTLPQDVTQQQTTTSIGQSKISQNQTGVNDSAGGASGANNANNASIAQPSNFGTQIATNLSNEYSLFNDNTYKSQWGGENKQIYSSNTGLANENLPKADASKAPGYNRNILSSPVGSSKASSSLSTSPPGSVITAPIGSLPSGVNSGQQPINIMPVNTTVGNASAISPTIAISTIENVSTTNTNANSLQASQSTSASSNASISPGVIKPPQAIGQNSGSTAPPSGLAIQRPASSQHRPGTVGSNITNARHTPPTTAPVASLDASSTPMNFGPIGSNTPGRANGSGAIGFYDHLVAPTQQNMNANTHQMNYHMDANVGAAYNTTNPTPTSLTSRLNPRASAFSQPKTQQPVSQQPPIGTGIFHQQQQANPNFIPGKSLAPGRPQSQPPSGHMPNQRWYGVGSNSEYGGYVQNARDMINLENGMPGNVGSGGSPAAMSPNQGSGAQGNGLIQNQAQQPSQQQQSEDLRKMPRPIGTERATWKFNYPNMGVPGSGLSLEDNLSGVCGPNAMGATGQLVPQWLLEKQASQHSNWLMKQQYRYYGGGANITPGAGLGMGPTEYHHQQDPFHMPMDYHMSMQPPNLNQTQQMNLLPNYQYPQFVGHATDMSHMPDKGEMWDQHDKHSWPTNWTN